MAADGAGGRARRIKQHRIELHMGLVVECIGDNNFGLKSGTLEIAAQAFEARARTVKRCNPRTRGA